MVKLRIDRKEFNGRDVVTAVAFDPGLATGVATCRLYRLEEDVWEPSFETFVLIWPEDAKEIKRLVLDHDFIIVEEFKVRKDKALEIVGAPLWSAECTGWIKGLLIEDTNHRLIIQQPWQKEFCPKKAIKERLGFAPPTEHEWDALRHLMYYFSR